MNGSTRKLLIVAVVATAITGLLGYGQLASAGERVSFTEEFFIDDCDFSARGSNNFFILEPGYRLKLSGEEKDGTIVELTVTVQDQTRDVDGVRTRIVEERETHNGELVEVSSNYFAICQQTSSVFYFGEDVDIYEGGVVVSHAGAWLAGENDARPGIIMPGTILLGARYHQEIAPGVAMDRAEIVSMGGQIETSAGSFDDVVTMRETTPLEPRAVESKSHAKGIGLVQDGILKLTDYGFV